MTDKPGVYGIEINPPIMKLGRLAIWRCLTKNKTIDGNDPTLCWLMGADPEEFKWTCAQPIPEFVDLSDLTYD